MFRPSVLLRGALLTIGELSSGSCSLSRHGDDVTVCSSVDCVMVEVVKSSGAAY